MKLRKNTSARRSPNRSCGEYGYAKKDIVVEFTLV
jgi:hypothetical protein